MKTKTLYVIGDSQTVTFFRLLGAEGIIAQAVQDLEAAYTTLETQLQQVGGILISSDLATKPSRSLDKIMNLGVPIISLPSQDESESFSHRLEILMEKAIGMKLKKGD